MILNLRLFWFLKNATCIVCSKAPEKAKDKAPYDLADADEDAAIQAETARRVEEIQDTENLDIIRRAKFWHHTIPGKIVWKLLNGGTFQVWLH